jgi:AraC family transcriptional regulator, L-rhamnose operon transcriptional activator RhaR
VSNPEPAQPPTVERLLSVAVLGQRVSIDSRCFRLNGNHSLHDHEFYEAAVVLGGAGVHASPLGEQTLRAGDAFLLRPGAWHAYFACENLEVFNCYFAPELLRYELSWTLGDPALGDLLWTGTRAGTHGIVSAFLEPSALKDVETQLQALCEGLSLFERIARLLLFLGQFANAVPNVSRSSTFNVHPVVLRGVQMLEANPSRQWSLTELADALHVAPSYLSRLFRQHLGLPPISYLARWRAERAAALLLGTTRPINDIAEEVGWGDPNYFSRRFKQHFGVSASAYRASQAQREPD